MREIDNAKIRSLAVMIEMESLVLSSRAAELREKFDELHKELEFADPVNDREFEQFLLKLSRVIMDLQALDELRESAHVVSRFRLPNEKQLNVLIADVRRPLIAEATHA